MVAGSLAKVRAVKVAEPATALPTPVYDYLAHCPAWGAGPNTVNQVYARTEATTST